MRSKEQQLPKTKQGWEEYLASSVEAGHKLTPGELALALYYFDTIEVGIFDNMVAHRLYPGLPDCPVYFNPRRLPDAITELLGRHLGLDFRDFRRRRTNRLAIAGIPRAGVSLAADFLGRI